MRKEIFQYVKKKYKTVPDYPFRAAPTYPVMRHADTRKWFALIMDVPREKLGLKGTEYVDIINVKLGDPMLADMLVRQPGYFYGYHITRSSWISILLDGTVPFEEICQWIDESYAVTASRKKKQKIRPPKEWINGSCQRIRSIMTSCMRLTMFGKLTGSRAEVSKPETRCSSMRGRRCRLSCINAG